MSSKKVKTEMANELPTDVTTLAHKTVDQAQAAFEKANDLAHSNVQMFDAAFSAYKNRFADYQLKAMELTQLNVNAVFTLARKVLAAKDATEAFALQQDFVKEQMQTLQRQATEINELAVSMAKDTMKPMQDSFSKGFTDFSKSFAA
jgi:phasin